MAPAKEDEFEVVGLEKFLNKIYPKISLFLESNIQENIFDNYDVIWEDEAIEETELTHRLVTNYDFADANSAT